MKSRSTVEHTTIAGISIILTRKTMRSIRMRVKRPSGEVHISAPHRVSRGFIESFVEARVEWIRTEQSRLQESKYQAPQRYEEGGYILFMGKTYTLRFSEGKTGVALVDDVMLLSIR